MNALRNTSADRQQNNKLLLIIRAVRHRRRFVRHGCGVGGIRGGAIHYTELS